jgi:Phosphate-selective porin O and P
MRDMRMVLSLVAVLAGGKAMAQTEAASTEGAKPPAADAPTMDAPAPAPATETPTPAPAVAAAPAVPAVSAPSATVEERLASVEKKNAELDKAREELKAMQDKASKLKITGFVQGRYEWHQDSVNGWDYSAKPTTTTPPGNAASSTKSTFYVRRARLDTVYSGTNAEFVLQLDAGGDTVGLRDAEAAFVDTWTPLHLRISVGQFKYPFGYELQQSDTAREMPERSRMIQQLFAGERDRGLKVQGSYQMLRFQIALVNGNGIQDPIFKAGKDENAWQDLVGRLGFDLTTVSGGLSGYYGANDVYNPAYNATTNPDTNPLNLKRFSRMRLGADVQGNLDVPSLGNLSLRGEVMYSRDKNKEYNGVAADACQDRIGWGWSLIAAQNIGNYLGAVVRVDGYDPLLKGSLDSTTCAGTTAKPGTYVAAGKDQIITYGGGLLVYVSANLKASFIYEHPTEQADKKVNNDIVTAQLQARF